MVIATDRRDLIRVCRVYAHCLEHAAGNGSRIPGHLRAAAECARDLANELAAQDLWDAAVNATRRADA